MGVCSVFARKPPVDGRNTRRNWVCKSRAGLDSMQRSSPRRHDFDAFVARKVDLADLACLAVQAWQYLGRARLWHILLEAGFALAEFLARLMPRGGRIEVRNVTQSIECEPTHAH